MSTPASSTSSPNRWLVAFLPPPAIQTRVEQVIQKLSDRYQTRTAYCPPHITLKPPFELPDIGPVVQALEQFATDRPPVPVTLNGFGAFPPRVLFVNVVKSPELTAIQAELVAYLKTQCGLSNRDRHKIYNPHITVASRKLTPRTFQQAWSELECQNFEGEFLGDRLTLFRYENRQWHRHQQFQLGGSQAGQ